MSVKAWSRGDGCDVCGAEVVYPASHCDECRARIKGSPAVVAFEDAMERLGAEVGLPYERMRFERDGEGGWR